jgi:hypothetical protein
VGRCALHAPSATTTHSHRVRTARSV